MKKIFFSILTIGAITIAACNNSSTKNKPEGHDVNKDTTQHTTITDDKEIKAVAVTYTDIDTKVAAAIKEIVDHYLHIKNALINDNGNEAAAASKEMEKAIGKVDKSLFTVEQKKLYDDIEDDLKEHAEHIGKNAGDIEHQREHFSMMSEDVYDLVKAFGGGQTLYHDHCPMANDQKGAMWLSEMKEVKNPYFGGKMNECVKVMEVIK
jgi:Protein of unknown function (DUF3347)